MPCNRRSPLSPTGQQDSRSENRLRFLEEDIMSRPVQRASYIAVIAALTCATALIAQSGAKNGEWRSYAGEEASTGYSPLDQINRDNVKDLKVAWAWKSDNFGTAEFKNESTPLMVKGVLYFTAGDRRAVVAV